MPHPFTHCLTHQLIEDQASPVGLVCARCKQRLYTAPPQGRCLSFWESQPAAMTLDRRPCFVFTLRWADFAIRSLHPAESDHDPRAVRIREAAAMTDRDWFEDSELDPRDP